MRECSAAFHHEVCFQGLQAAWRSPLRGPLHIKATCLCFSFQQACRTCKLSHMHTAAARWKASQLCVPWLSWFYSWTWMIHGFVGFFFILNFQRNIYSHVKNVLKDVWWLREWCNWVTDGKNDWMYLLHFMYLLENPPCNTWQGSSSSVLVKQLQSSRQGSIYVCISDEIVKLQDSSTVHIIQYTVVVENNMSSSRLTHIYL